MQASVLSVLSAVTDIIHDRSGGNSDAEYFGALVAAMPQDDADQKLSGRFIVFVPHFISLQFPQNASLRLHYY